MPALMVPHLNHHTQVQTTGVSKGPEQAVMHALEDLRSEATILQEQLANEFRLAAERRD